MASTTGMGYRYGAERGTQPKGDGALPAPSAEVAACVDQHTPDVIDYSIVDSAVVPPEAAAAMHSEALWVVSGCYMPEDPAQPMGECGTCPLYHWLRSMSRCNRLLVLSQLCCLNCSSSTTGDSCICCRWP